MGQPEDLTKLPLTEADVRRIVREELAGVFQRLEELEAAEEERSDAAEAATHAPDCKCGSFGHY